MEARHLRLHTEGACMCGRCYAVGMMSAVWEIMRRIMSCRVIVVAYMSFFCNDILIFSVMTLQIMRLVMSCRVIVITYMSFSRKNLL